MEHLYFTKIINENLKSAFIICFFSKYFPAAAMKIFRPTVHPRADYTQIDFEPSLSNDNQKLFYAHSGY